MIIQTKIKNGKIPKSIIEDIEEFLAKKKNGMFEIKIVKIRSKRTSQQNNALHLYFKLLANALNDAGFDMKKVIRKEIDIPWNGMTVKEYIWRPVQKIFLRKNSTTKLDKIKEIDQIYDIVNRIISERCGISIPFPNIEDEDYQKELAEKIATNF
ncbi:MAG: hypothetical protein HF967_03660 [Methanosarcinales archaeon]|nr:hypothetical protein [Methanosarcinales archaeon]